MRYASMRFLTNLASVAFFTKREWVTEEIAGVAMRTILENDYII